jgi:hypothetical protein
MAAMPTCTWSACGLSERDTTLLMSWMGLSNGHTRAMWEPANGLDVDMVFCNPRESFSLEVVKRQQLEGRPVCISVLKVGERPLPNTLALPLPVKIGNFFTLLEETEERLLAPSSEFDARVLDLTSAKTRQYGPTESHTTLLSAIHRMIESPAPGTTRFSVAAGWIEIDVERRLFRSSAQNEEALIKSFGVEGVEFATHQVVARLDDRVCSSLERIFWLCSLLDTGDALLPDLDDLQRLKLAQWPDFGIAAEASRYVGLCAIVTNQALNVAEMAQLAQLSHQDVRRFLNACKLLGLLVPVSVKSTREIVPHAAAVQTGVNGNPSTRILNKIRGALSMVWR